MRNKAEWIVALACVNRVFNAWDSSEPAKDEAIADAVALMNRAEKLALIWRHTSKDYRGTYQGSRTVLSLRANGTCLVLLDDLTDDEIARKMRYAIWKEAEREMAKVAA